MDDGSKLVRGEERTGALTRRAFLSSTASVVAGTGAVGAALATYGARTAAAARLGRVGARLTPLTYVFILPPNLSFAPELLADMKGYFRDEGLDVSFQSARGSAPAIQLLIQNKATLATGVGIELQLHILREQAPISYVATIQHASPLGYGFLKKERLVSPKSWIGRTMGVSSPGGSSELTFRVFLANGGVDASKVKIQVVTGAVSATTVELIRRGRLDGAVFGLVQLAGYDFPDFELVPFSRTVTDTFGYITSAQQAKTKQKALEAYFRAIRRAILEIVAQKPSGYAKTIDTLRQKYDFDELKKDATARAWLDFMTAQWLAKGRKNVLRTLPAEWKAIYDGLVRAKLAPAGKNPMPWMTNRLV